MPEKVVARDIPQGGGALPKPAQKHKGNVAGLNDGIRFSLRANPTGGMTLAAESRT
jgi:hypothetical protein